MTAKATVSDKGQITIPKNVRDAFDLHKGDVVDVRLTGPGTITITKSAVVEIDPEQAWFWTPEWQAKMRAAKADVEAGRTTVYDSGDDFLQSLA